MEEKKVKLFNLFKVAIEAEKNAQELYRKTLEVCDDPQMRELLVGFLRDEERHEKTIVEKYKEYKEKFKLE